MTNDKNPSMTDLFGEVIHSYSRADAIEDGFLVDLTEYSNGYFKFPVAITSAFWAIIEKAVNNDDYANSYEGVLHDVFSMALWQMRIKKDTSIVYFKVIIAGAGRKRNYIGKVTCSPGDSMEPVLTFMLRDED